jgi:uncharacterized protein YgiM (DUF1202 family)
MPIKPYLHAAAALLIISPTIAQGIDAKGNYSRTLQAPPISQSLLNNQRTQTVPPPQAQINHHQSLKPVTNKEMSTPFTGKVTKNKVRLRMSPNLDSPIIKELNQGDLLLILGEEEEFYTIQAPDDLKGYVFRTYILDDVVEGNRVNIRLEPQTDSPVIGQLVGGEKVTGKVSSINNKWMEISLPENVRLYISKDYVKRIGDASYFTSLKNKQKELKEKLEQVSQQSENALKGDYPSINYQAIANEYQSIINGYTELDEEKTKVEGQLKDFKDAYAKKKIEYLEAHTGSIQDAEKLKQEKISLENKMREQQKRLAQLEQTVQINPNLSISAGTMPLWQPVEQELYLSWKEKNGDRSWKEFYKEQLMDSVTIKGTIEPYTRKVKNKPGDYLLIGGGKRPVAFLYSTQVNLQDYVGREVTLRVSSRPNNHFAFPAYFVLSIE